MGQIGNLVPKWQYFEIVAEVPDTEAVAAAVGLHTADQGLGTEAVELRTAGLVAVDCKSGVLGKLGSLGERRLQQTVWRAS